MKPLTIVSLSALTALSFQAASASERVERSEQHPVLIMQEGDVIPGTSGRSVWYLSGPVNAGEDHVGIVAVMSDDEEGALWIGHHTSGGRDLILAKEYDAIYFAPNRFGATVVDVEGSSDQGHTPFVVKAMMHDSRIALLNTWGVVQVLGEGAPGLRRDAQVTAIERIDMLLNGQAYWVADWQAPGEAGRAFFRKDPGPWGRVQLLMNTGDTVCGGELQNLRHFRMAQNQTRGHVVDVRIGNQDRTALFVDGQCLRFLGEPLPGSSERPTDFRFFDVNGKGNVLLGAITDAPENRNGVFVLDGEVVMREGDVIDGVVLEPSLEGPNQVRLDDRGRAVTLWAGDPSSTFTIFFTPDITRFDETRKVVSEGSPLDFDGDGVVDATLYRFRFFGFSGPTMSLGDTGIHIAVELEYPGSNERVAAVIFYPF